MSTFEAPVSQLAKIGNTRLAAIASRSFVAVRNFQPRRSTAPASPANAPEIASARK